MRKLMLFILLPIMAWSQTISQSGGVVTIGGDLKYGFIHAVGSADSQSVALTVTQNVYKKMAITGMAWREADGITNLTASRNPTITDIKIYCEKKPE